MQISRRNFLSGTLLSPIFVRMTLSGSAFTVGLMGLSSPLRAEIITAMATASAAANTIASLVQGDGGLGASLSHIHQKLDLITSEIGLLHLELGKLGLQLEKLDELIDEKFLTTSLRIQQATCLSVADQYRLSIATIQDYSSIKEWRQKNRDSLLLMLSKLQTATGIQARLEGRDATTAYLLCVLPFLEASLRTSIGEESFPAIRRQLLDRYLPWFDDIISETMPYSAFNKLKELRAKYDHLMAEIGASRLGQKFSFQQKTEPNACFGINEFYPNRIEMDFTGCINETRRCPGRYFEVPGTSRTIPQEHIYQMLTLSEAPAVVDGSELGVSLYQLEISAVAQGLETQLPFDRSQCSIETLELHDTGQRLQYLKARPDWQQSLSEAVTLRANLDKINFFRLRMLYNFDAMVASEAARSKMMKMLEV